MENELKVLGFSLGFDAGAAIVSNKKGILSAVNEERMDRNKNSKYFPLQSMKECLDLSKIDTKEIDFIAYSDYEEPDLYDLMRYIPSEYNKYIKPEYLDIFNKLKQNEDYRNIYRMDQKANKKAFNEVVRSLMESIGICKEIPIRRIDHHYSHAVPSFIYSGFNETVAITADGFGDGYSMKMIYLDEYFNERVLAEVPLEGSLALVYQFVTGAVGFTMHRHEGKITGISARGDASKTIEEFRDLMYYDKKERKIKYKYSWNVDKTFGDKVNPIKDFAYFKDLKEKVFNLCSKYELEDLAAGVQKFTEEIMIEMITDILNKEFRYLINVSLSGGLFANVRLNQLIGNLPQIKQLSVFPAMGDAGLAVGAASGLLYSAHAIKPMKIESLYLGTDIEDQKILTEIEANGLEFETTENRSRTIARLIAQENIVANVKGKMEYGPRALCNRSIHFHCSDPGINLWLNKQLGRDERMPFCPVIQYEDAEKAFTDATEKTKIPGETMGIGFYATKEFIEQCPSGVHIDGTARAQLLKEEVNPDIYKALEIYKKITGKFGFINTSFNAHGEPLVRTAKEAIERFLESNIHYLVINDYVIKHPDYKDISKFK